MRIEEEEEEYTEEEEDSGITLKDIIDIEL